jgi:hypothetical protein
MNRKVTFLIVHLCRTLWLGAVVAGAASRYGSGSTKMMQLFADPAPHHCFVEYRYQV